MKVEELIEIFDRCWFESDMFNTQKPKSSNSEEPVPNGGPGKSNDNLGTMLSRAPTVLVRSMSDQLASETNFSPAGSVSPDSVLGGSKLRSIPSGKEAGVDEGNAVDAVLEKEMHTKMKEKRRRRLVRRGGTTTRVTSKSLSELEFEEVKGFMDLGFVFSEEDRGSSLAEIIPGLHRLGKSAEEEGEDENESVARPYLSESWEWWDKQREDEEERRRPRPWMHWDVPVSGDKSDIKRSLRLWAHNVASTYDDVRTKKSNFPL